MPYCRCKCGREFHVRPVGDLVEWYAKFAPGKGPGEVVDTLACVLCTAKDEVAALTARLKEAQLRVDMETAGSWRGGPGPSKESLAALTQVTEDMLACAKRLAAEDRRRVEILAAIAEGGENS